MKTIFFAIFLFFFVVSKKQLQRELIVQISSPTHEEDLKIFLSQKSTIASTLIPLLPKEFKTRKNKSNTLMELERLFYVFSLEKKNEELLRTQIQKLPFVTAAYFKPIPQLANYVDDSNTLSNWKFTPSSNQDKSQPPNYQHMQGYLKKAPEGINQESSFNVPGGRGDNVKFIDIEIGWTFNHEDLKGNTFGLVSGVNYELQGIYDHGDAVIGEVCGNDNGYGILGIAPNTRWGGASIWQGTNLSYPVFAKTILDSAQRLSKGDIILIELHAPGPRCNFVPCREGTQEGYIAMEYWYDNFITFKFVIEELGIIVVEAAGNGGENFDDPIYSRRHAGFPIEWRNPFNRAIADSGVIIVGAGAPPPGTNGRDHGPDRSRLGFSNYGSAVDCQGWGREIVTAGYGDLRNVTRTSKYTIQFGGTSGASPIVVGCVAAMSGILKARGRVLNPLFARELLRRTGSPQQDHSERPKTQRIGNRPNLEELIRAL